jgi:NADPH:quinone reductase-like Zn-dependent oxidoreductase
MPAAETTTPTMTAIVQDTYGTAEVLERRQVARPDIGATDVLIRVAAAGVNPADWAVMNGLPYIARPVYGTRRPKDPIRGTDVAGTVAAVGPGVTRFEPGDQIFGTARGSFAQYAAASEDRIAPKPATLDFEQAAAVPMAGLVALQALRTHGEFRTGQRVLINGASGGIGHLAVQIAVSLGAHVTGVTSARNQELVRSLGALEVIDYAEQDFTRGDDRYDFILDNVADHPLVDLRRALTPDGTLVPNGGGFEHRWFANGGRVIQAHLVNRFTSHHLRPFLLSYNPTDLATLSELIATGAITPVIDRAYPLHDAAQALRHVGDGHTRGKVVIRPDPHTAAPPSSR